MQLTAGLLIVLYCYVIYRAIQFFRMPGDAREDDKIVGTAVIAASVMFILARIVTYAINPASASGFLTQQALWGGFGFFNAMLYLGLVHRMVVYRSSRGTGLPLDRLRRGVPQ